MSNFVDAYGYCQFCGEKVEECECLSEELPTPNEQNLSEKSLDFPCDSTSFYI